MRIRIAVPDKYIDDPTIDAALEAVTRANERMIREGAAPLLSDVLRKGAVRWQPEPPGDEHFDLASVVARRGWGDCDDLAPWDAAEQRATGRDPGARAVVRKSGPNRWHAIVRGSNGTVRDPSRAAGMGRTGVSGDFAVIGAAHLPLLPATAHLRATLTVVPWRGRGFAARADIPWSGTPGAAFASHSYDRTPLAAAVRAIQGACVVGDASGAADPEALLRLAALHDLLHGANPRQVYESLASSGVDPRGLANAAKYFRSMRAVSGGKIGFLPLLGPALSMAAPLLSAVPGVSSLFGGGGGAAPAAAPAAPAAAPAAAPMMPFPPYGGGGAVVPSSGGPVIVRF